jgi:transaldolase
MALADLNIDLKAVTDQLEQEGVVIFAKAFDNLLQHIEHKVQELAA